MHPALELVFNPVAGPASFNAISVIFYLMVAVVAVAGIIERRGQR